MLIDGADDSVVTADKPHIAVMVTIRRRIDGATTLRAYSLMRGQLWGIITDRTVAPGQLSEAAWLDFQSKVIDELQLATVMLLGQQQDLLG